MIIESALIIIEMLHGPVCSLHLHKHTLSHYCVMLLFDALLFRWLLSVFSLHRYLRVEYALTQFATSSCLH